MNFFVYLVTDNVSQLKVLDTPMKNANWKLEWKVSRSFLISNALKIVPEGRNSYLIQEKD